MSDGLPADAVETARWEAEKRKMAALLDGLWRSPCKACTHPLRSHGVNVGQQLRVRCGEPACPCEATAPNPFRSEVPR